jgi:hypothetical protein
MSSDLTRHRTRGRIALIALGGVCLLPVYWLQLSYVLQFVIRSPGAMGRAAGLGAVTLTILGAYAWNHSVRLGAIIQVLLLLPGVLGLVTIFRGQFIRATWGGGIDMHFVAGLLAVGIAPGAVLAFAAIALRRRQRRR